MVTLQDVAQVTGVSIATVSRVLNGDSRISTDTAQRVRETLDSLGYRRMGRGADARTHDVAFMVADPQGHVYEDLFFNEILRGMAEYLEPRGYAALGAPTSGRLGDKGRLPRVVHRVDGVIAGGINLRIPLIKALMKGQIPTVFIGRYLRGRSMNAILPDNEEGARLATEHLLALGRRTVAFVGGPPGTYVHRDRLAGFSQVLEAAGLKLNEKLVRSAERTVQGGYNSMVHLLDEALSSASFPDAVFAADDLIAIGALRALRQRGYRVPEDVAVVGYSDLPLASEMDPPLTTVHVPKRRLGRIAAKLLLDIIEEDIEGPVQMVVSPHLRVRESTAAGRTQDYENTVLPEGAQERLDRPVGL